MSGIIKTKVLVLADADRRSGEGGEYLSTLVLEKDSLAVKQLNGPVKFADVLSEDSSLLLVNISVASDMIRLSNESKAFQCGKFSVNQDVIDEIKCPKEITVGEVLRSPKKVKVSVRGLIRKVSEVIETPKSVRRELYLEGTDGTQTSVTLKLWGKKTEIPIPPINSVVCAKCVMVSSFRGVTELESTVLTTLEENAEEVSFDGQIEGVEFGEEASWIYINDDCLKVADQVISKIFPDRKFLDGIFVSGRCSGITVVEMSVANPVKRTKTD